ncbi:tyrosinase family protein [Sphingosinicella sp. BN140058]|uniref:tyrosinase family protein n=1 Tax=Sphingosinicella sp. BN140058 TaxID=1892855 RepID=UPI0010120794|nr:tyrosinase family protein [Sphingosinicella sp. BN140058]QAY78213.1 hypothetical protein ETR14_18005 [Sphingosinicella sp. BN140058]
MKYLRRNAGKLGSDWSDPILWYARGVAAMRRRPLAEPTSWRFFAAIRGFDPGLWQKLGWLRPSDAPPARDLVVLYWNQRRRVHGQDAAWHRFYLLAFEANIRSAIEALGGPKDWALPFCDPQDRLPPAFVSPDWPDGHGNNPLFSIQRYGPSDDGRVPLPTGERVETAGDMDAKIGRLIGGEDPHPPHLPGLMAEPNSAALDPIFWLVEADLDRARASIGSLPVPSAASAGEQLFTMPMTGNARWQSTAAEMADPAALDYSYASA